MACAADQSVETDRVEKDFFSSSSEYVRLLSGDAKQRYISKLRYSGGNKQLPDPYGLVDGWSEDPKHWPDVTFGDVYAYLIEIPGPFTRESMKAYKSLEAYDFFIAGHVQPVFHNFITDESPYCFLKAKVIPSQRVKSKPHEAWVCCTKKTGSVYCAHCTCMAG